MRNAKKKILEVAEELISENGVSGTTIANVAQAAGIADSLVYKYFKGKEDLLFSIAFERLQQALVEFDEALQGIKDAASRLSRMVWYSLRYNDHYPGYSRTLLFECRSNPNFYTSPAYDLLRRHAAMTMGILRQGVEDGLFREDVHLRLVRDIIYGTLDFETIGTIAAAEVDEGIHDFDAIMGLIIPMITRRDPAPDVSREEKLIAAGEAVFAMHGFEKATISEIARLAETSEGTLYDYFKSKEELLLSIPLKRFREHLNQLPEVFQIESPERKLRRLLRYHFTLYTRNWDFLKIFLMDIQLNMRFYESEAYEVFQEYVQVMEEVIEEGKSKNIFRPDVNPRVFRNMFLGAFTHMALRWIIVKKDRGYNKMKEIDHLVDLMTCAISLKKPLR
jgi:TetR/AcrR family fatty acid metabolism transcriptional regulator